MSELLILIPPCRALMAAITSPAVRFLVVLALAVTLSILMTILCLQTWNVRDVDELETQNDFESDPVIEDATKIVQAAFSALARSPGATSTSFRAVNGTVMHQTSTSGDLDKRDGSAGGIWSEEDDSKSHYTSGTGGRRPEYWPELFQAWGRDPTISNDSSRKGHPGFLRLGLFGISVRSLEDADSIAQMV